MTKNERTCFGYITGFLLHKFNHFLPSVEGWEDILVELIDYTIKFSAISSKVVVSETIRKTITH